MNQSMNQSMSLRPWSSVSSLLMIQPFQPSIRAGTRLKHTIPESLLNKVNSSFKRIERNYPSESKSKSRRLIANVKELPYDLVKTDLVGTYSFRRPQNYKVSARPQGTTYDLQIDPSFVRYVPLEIDTPPVPKLEHKLSRVLFSPGVHYLQDPRTKVFNFNPYLHHIMPVTEFDFGAIQKYVTSSKDKLLSKVAKENDVQFYSSTSSMTGVLTQFHLFLSNFRPVSFMNYSKHNTEPYGTFTKSVKLAASVIVSKKDGVYSIDSEKSTDQEIILSLLGNSLERVLTKSPEEFEKYRLVNGVSKIGKESTEGSYHYAKMENFLMRSQLDCQDSRLPGTGTFDLKTRAVSAVRHDIAKVTRDSTGYQINKTYGRFETFEREQLELSRSALIKYSLQARIGNMDGIFMAYHNTVRMFGFEYMPLRQIDEVLHSFGLKNFEKDKVFDLKSFLSSKIANDEFKISMKLWNKLLKLIIERELPDDSFRFMIKAIPVSKFESKVRIVAHKIDEEGIEELNQIAKGFEQKLTRTPQSELKDLINSQINDLDELNDKIRDHPFGFDVYVRHYVNGMEFTKRHPVLTSLDDIWSSEFHIVKLNNSETRKSYYSFLDERNQMLAENVGIKEDDEVDEFIKILRQYGRRGEELQTLEGSNQKVVWNNE